MAETISEGGVSFAIDDKVLERKIREYFKTLDKELNKILIVAPDFTRFNSYAGRITEMIYEYLNKTCSIDIIPALGTHYPMTEKEIKTMFGNKIPLECFKVHNWRDDVVKKGVVPGEKLKEWSEGKVDFDVKVEVNKILFEGYDLILSIGQVVPHEVVGMANYTKNIMVGIGGADTINKSHFLGAVYNMERIMGKANTPVRKLFNTGVDNFLGDLPIHYMLTVMARNNETGKMDMKGFFAGRDEDTFLQACELCEKVNLEFLDKPLKKVVVYLDPEEFKSTWLGNKAVYRSRMAIADDGELIILAPGLKEFGEDPEIDSLIRKYGYRGMDFVLKAVEENDDLRENLSAAAHLIHGSSEGRFSITYCPEEKVSKEEIEGVNFRYMSYREASEKYNSEELKDGFNKVDGEEIFYISNPALGLWAYKE